MKRLPKSDAKQVLMGMVTRSQRPLLVGVAAVRLGVLWSIEETEALFEELAEEGRVRRLNREEQRIYGLQEGYVRAGVDPEK
jgi:hypothetical protein